jgi:outer membrane protein OmpA-like peptidoglycan-associated protein
LTVPGLSLEGERGHRRGVVMGLTMAEIMLLLLFCLLLASAGIVKEREAALEEATDALKAAQSLMGDRLDIADVAAMKKRVAELETESQRLRELVVLEPSRSSTAIPEESWRELELSSRAGQEIIDAGVSVSEVLAAVTEIRERASVVEPGGPGVHEWPPIITLGNDEFRFSINSAELSDEFRNRLDGHVANELRSILAMYDVDVIEVVGHTDESPIASSRGSTLDQKAIDALSGNVDISELVPADNVGLGLARAIAVARSLNFALADLDVKIIPLSAAQLVVPGDRISNGENAGNDADRRRIEIRVRKSSEESTF